MVNAKWLKKPLEKQASRRVAMALAPLTPFSLYAVFFAISEHSAFKTGLSVAGQEQELYIVLLPRTRWVLFWVRLFRLETKRFNPFSYRHGLPLRHAGSRSLSIGCSQSQSIKHMLNFLDCKWISAQLQVATAESAFNTEFYQVLCTRRVAIWPFIVRSAYSLPSALVDLVDFVADISLIVWSSKIKFRGAVSNVHLSREICIVRIPTIRAHVPVYVWHIGSCV